jgi:hypothetical protein
VRDTWEKGPIARNVDGRLGSSREECKKVWVPFSMPPHICSSHLQELMRAGFIGCWWIGAICRIEHIAEATRFFFIVGKLAGF